MGLSLDSNVFNFVMADSQYKLCVPDPLAYTFMFLVISANFFIAMICMPPRDSNLCYFEIHTCGHKCILWVLEL